MTSVAVTSRSFSKNPILREALCVRYNNVVFNETGKTLEGHELIHFLQGHALAIIGLERLDASVLNALPDLKVISRFGVGIDTIDTLTMKKRGIRLAYAAGANKRAVSEMVIAFAMNMLRQLPFANDQVRRGKWLQIRGRQLSHCCVGIIGLGAIGQDLAMLLNAFNCKLLTYDIIDRSEFCLTHQISQVSLEGLLQNADIVSLHLPLNNATKMILNADRLKMMKHNAILINTARGELVDEVVLKHMLLDKKMAGAAFDVFASEPPKDFELLSLPNFFCTPHIAGITDEAILAMGHAAIEGLEKAVSV